MVFECLSNAAKNTGKWIWGHRIAIGVTTMAVGGVTYYGYRKLTSTFDQFSKEFELLAKFKPNNIEGFYGSIEFEKTIKRELKSLIKALDDNVPFPSKEEIGINTKNLSKEQKLKYWEDLKVLGN